MNQAERRMQLKLAVNERKIPLRSSQFPLCKKNDPTFLYHKCKNKECQGMKGWVRPYYYREDHLFSMGFLKQC